MDGMVIIGHRSFKSTFGANDSRVSSAFGDISGFYARRYSGVCKKSILSGEKKVEIFFRGEK